jgi:hypothetical protein
MNPEIGLPSASRICASEPAETSITPARLRVTVENTETEAPCIQQPGDFERLIYQWPDPHRNADFVF